MEKYKVSAHIGLQVRAPERQFRLIKIEDKPSTAVNKAIATLVKLKAFTK